MTSEVPEKRKPGSRLSQQSIEILSALRYDSQSEVARRYNVSRQLVNRLKMRYLPNVVRVDFSSGRLEYREYKDTGCLDGAYPSCLNCPLGECREGTDDN